MLYGSAMRSITHGIQNMNVAKQFSIDSLDFFDSFCVKTKKNIETSEHI